MTNSIFDLQNYYFNLYALPHFVVGVLIALEGIYVFSQSKKAVNHIAYAATTVTAGIWLTGVGIASSMSNEALSTVFSRWYTWFGIIFVTPAVYFFSATWDAELLKEKKKKIYFHYLCALGFYLICVLTPHMVSGMYRYRAGFFPKAGALEPVFIVWFYTVMTLAFLNFIRIYREGKTPVVKKVVRLIFLAFAIAFLGSVEYLPNYGIPVFPVAFLPVFLFTTIMGYCVIRYRLMDIETVIHMTLMWLITSAIAILPFIGIIYSTQHLAVNYGPPGTAVYFLVLALTFYFYFRSLQPRLAQLFQRQRSNLMGVFDRFSRELVHLKDLRDLLQSFARMLRRQVYVRRLSVFLYDEVKNEYAPVIAKGIRNLRPVPASHPFLEWLEKTDAVTLEHYVVSDPEVQGFKAEITDCFTKAQASVAVPLVIGGKMIGVAFLGKKATLKRYNAGEIQFLTKLKVPVTIAFSNSVRYEAIRELSEELRRWNEELEVRVEERTKELVKTQEQLIQAEKLATLGTLAGGVAHEINNPLTAVLTNAQILKMTADKDTKESLDLIEEGAKRCQQIVQKLMKYARKTAEEAPHKPVNLNDVVKSTLNLIGFQFKQENIEVVTELGEIPPVLGIANELEQVLTNLLVNARDAVKIHGPKGKIEVITRAVKDGVELIVKDNGIGIAKENLKKIFDPFFTTKDVGAGTGLGLAVTFGILKRHNATISAESEPGKGSTFTIKFPKQKP